MGNSKPDNLEKEGQEVILNYNLLMGVKDINIIWMDAFNERCSKYHITSVMLHDYSSCVYQLEDHRELRITVNPRMYNFTKVLKTKQYKHIVKIYDCFKMVLPDQNEDEQNVFCIVTERLNRNFQPRVTIQSAINLFRNIWSDYLKCNHCMETPADVCIEKAYSQKDRKGREYVLERIRTSGHCQEIIDIAISLNDAYRRIKELDPHSTIYLFTDNIGLADDSTIKLCNISHDYLGLDENYDVDTTRNSVTITYNPIVNDDFVSDNRILIPLNVDFGNGELFPVMGQIDTGASSSGFTKEFYERASLIYLGSTTTSGVTGTMESCKTICDVTFPNGYKTTLRGTTIGKLDDVSILIGMDLLSRCKFMSEPFGNGFRYKLIFK